MIDALPDLRDIVRQHGGDLYAGGNAATIPAPGHSARDRSLSLRLDGDRIVWHSFTGELSHGAVMDYLGISQAEGRRSTPADLAKARAARERAKREEAARDMRFCAAAWAGAVPLEGTPAEAYLWSRNLIFEGVGDLRFHPAFPRSKEPGAATHPAMVALVRTATGEPQALHATFINPDGSGKAFGKRSRLMFGSVRGGSVHLGAPRDGVLAVSEGIETGGAYSTLKGVATWPALSSGGLSAFVIPRRVRRLIIAADGDESGKNAALMLAERAAKVCDVTIDAAPDGSDWADVLEAQQ